MSFEIQSGRNSPVDWGDDNYGLDSRQGSCAYHSPPPSTDSEEEIELPESTDATGLASIERFMTLRAEQEVVVHTVGGFFSSREVVKVRGDANGETWGEIIGQGGSLVTSYENGGWFSSGDKVIKAEPKSTCVIL
ncbi:MAG: hypothetical protein P0S94_04005 [Simkaniaceae bacterium]|nr:hypothetical protein [Simkaniaceae bacterium]